MQAVRYEGGMTQMTKRWLNARAADVRNHWTAQERRQRAKAGEVRVRELLDKLGLIDVGAAPAWATPATVRVQQR
jgi:hypothetical protein